MSIIGTIARNMKDAIKTLANSNDVEIDEDFDKVIVKESNEEMARAFRKAQEHINETMPNEETMLSSSNKKKKEKFSQELGKSIEDSGEYIAVVTEEKEKEESMENEIERY